MSVSIFAGNRTIPVKWWNFPAGERGIKIEDTYELGILKSAGIIFKFEGSQDIVDLMLLVDATRRAAPNIQLWLDIEYFPFARQDRVMSEGESLSLKVFADIVNSLKFWQVKVVDPHSDVLAALITPGALKIIPQYEIAYSRLVGNEFLRIGNIALLAPDAGALKKIHPLAKMLNMPVITARKVRDVSTGNITSTEIDGDISGFDKLIVVDDICDGGRTFIELAKATRVRGFTGSLALFVTHGIFSQGIEVLKEHYDVVECYNDMRKDKNV